MSGPVFSRTCGHLPVNCLASGARLVAAPHCSAPGCDGPRHAAHVVVRGAGTAGPVADLQGLRLAVNGEDSCSGHHVRRHLPPAGESGQTFFGQVAATGSRRARIRSMLAGEADAGAVDCVTRALLSDRLGDELRGARIFMTSPSTPGLPCVTAAATSDDEIRKLGKGLFAALAGPALGRARKALRLAGASVLRPEDCRTAFSRMPERIPCALRPWPRAEASD